MTVPSVVRPLPGPGLVARSGDLLLVCSEGTDATRAEVEQLLNLIPEVAAAGGDGTVLVRRVAALLAADLDGLFPDCAVCGPAPDGRLAVLVYGAATARVVGRDGEVRLSAVDVVASVNRLVPGPITAIRLELPGAGQPSRFARLEGGVVSAAGFVAGEETSGGTVSAVPAQPGPATEAARFEPSAPAIPPPSASPETVTPAPIVTPAPPAEEPAPASPRGAGHERAAGHRGPGRPGAGTRGGGTGARVLGARPVGGRRPGLGRFRAHRSRAGWVGAGRV